MASTGARHLHGHRRVDGRANHEAVLRAACEVFADTGAGTSLEAVARRAGVGIATVYRHVGSRAELQRSVVLVALRVVEDAATRALWEEPDERRALRRFLGTVLDQHVGGVVPELGSVVDLLADGELAEARTRSRAAVEELVCRAREAGALRPEVTSADLAMILARLAQRLPGDLSTAEQDDLARRHLRLVLEGLAV